MVFPRAEVSLSNNRNKYIYRVGTCRVYRNLLWQCFEVQFLNTSSPAQRPFSVV